MQNYFYHLADFVKAQLRGPEVFTAQFSSEDSDFVRFNHAEIRQAGHVMHHSMSVDLINGRRHATGGTTLSGNQADDEQRLAALVADLREKYATLPEDPYLLYATDVQSTERHGDNHLPDSTAAITEIQQAGRSHDLVGIYAAGGIHVGFANAFGQRNWFSTHSYNFDWSFHLAADKAIKSSYAGFDWDGPAFRRKVDWAGEQLAVLGQPATTIQPGRYRVYLAPAALNDLVGILSWGGFGLKSHRTKQTPLLKMVEGDARLHPSVSLLENTRDGIAPNFQEAGFLRPDQVRLIDGGAFRDCLVSPRSAKEYGVPTNGAGLAETPESVDLAAGTLPLATALQQLDTGVYVGNLWYLNYSDRNACRTTGMTRFATFWVEHGVVQGPLNVMRFDETLYRALGENLAALTSEREFILDPETYFGRSTRSGRIPGALIEDFTFTL